GAAIDYSYFDVVNSTFSNEGPAIRAIVGSPSVVASTLVTTGDVPTVQITEEGEFHPRGTIVAGPDTSPRCSMIPGEAEVVSQGWNLATDASCSLDEPGDLENADPMLGPVADNDGPTVTRMIAAASAALDAIPAGTLGLCDGTVPADQRGLPRPSG